MGRVGAGDDRVGASPQTVTLDLGGSARGRTIAWRIDYQRVEHPLGASDGDDDRAVVAESTTVAGGEVQ
jgi:hypothetical protein